MKFDIGTREGGAARTGSASGNGTSGSSLAGLAFVPARPRPPRLRRRATPATFGAASLTKPLSRLRIVARFPDGAARLSAGCENPGVTGPPLLFDLGARGAIVLAGKDRASFLHGLVTNDTRKLTPGTGCAAAFLTPKGKMLADCVVLCEEDRLEIDCEPELAGKIEDLLRKYLVFNDVTIENHTAARAVLHVTGDAAGNAAEDLLRRVIGPGAGDPLPASPHAHARLRIPLQRKYSASRCAAGSRRRCGRLPPPRCSREPHRRPRLGPPPPLFPFRRNLFFSSLRRGAAGIARPSRRAAHRRRDPALGLRADRGRPAGRGGTPRARLHLRKQRLLYRTGDRGPHQNVWPCEQAARPAVRFRRRPAARRESLPRR